jgi:hypothetical protein
VFLVEEGRQIDPSQPIRMFDGVKIMAHYLESRHDLNPDLIDKTKLTDVLDLFEKNGGTITVEEIYEYLSVQYKKNKSFYNETLNTESDNLSKILNSITDESNTSKPFGQYGEVTLNQIGVTLKENLKHLKDIN